VGGGLRVLSLGIRKVEAHLLLIHLNDDDLIHRGIVDGQIWQFTGHFNDLLLRILISNGSAGMRGLPRRLVCLATGHCKQ
jgi:hypothetical protein